MPRDDQDDKDSVPATVALGRAFRGEASPAVTTPEAVAATQARGAAHASKPGAVAILVYFVAKGIQNPILQASMLAYTDVRVAPVGDFDEIFAEHHEVPAAKTEETEP